MSIMIIQWLIGQIGFGCIMAALVRWCVCSVESRMAARRAPAPQRQRDPHDEETVRDPVQFERSAPRVRQAEPRIQPRYEEREERRDFAKSARPGPQFREAAYDQEDFEEEEEYLDEEPELCQHGREVGHCRRCNELALAARLQRQRPPVREVSRSRPVYPRQDSRQHRGAARW